MGEKSRLTFRISLWRPWLLALTPLALLAALGVAIFVVGGKLAAAESILLGFAGVAVVLLLPIGLTVGTSRWHVDPYGIGVRTGLAAETTISSTIVWIGPKSSPSSRG